MLENAPSKARIILGWILVILICSGSIFKMLHWPGGSPLLVLGTFFMAFLYTPLWLQDVWKDNKERITSVVYFILLEINVLGALWKMQHWAGSGPLMMLGSITTLYFLFPYSLYWLFKFGKDSSKAHHYMVIIIFLATNMYSMLKRSNEGAININTVYMQAINSERELKVIEERNMEFYESFKINTTNDDETINSKVQKLNLYCKQSVDSITLFSNTLIAAADNISLSKADSLHITEVENKINSDIPTKLIFDGNDSPNEAFKAKWIRNKVNSFKDSILKFVPEEKRLLLKKGIALNTEDVYDENGERYSWEEANFSQLPLIQVLITLNDIRCVMRNAESAVLYNLQNELNNKLSINIAEKLAEHSATLNLKDKEDAINKLIKKRAEDEAIMNNAQVNADEMEKAIIWFAFASTIFIMMLFFIIRSNIQRKKLNKTLEQQKNTIEEQSKAVEKQAEELYEKNKEITDSITYAKRLQEAILPAQNIWKSELPESFILYRPKDIVAGDFYWMEHIGDELYFAAADCTGHGVPGAMVSIVCSNALNRSVKEFDLKEPGEILDKTRQLVIETFAKNNADVKDGMDISLMAINKNTGNARWAGANNPLWIVKQGTLHETKANKQPIGLFSEATAFTTNHITLQKGDCIYLLTDGYPDQFGGPKGKKFKYKQLEDLLVEIANKPMEEQQQILEKRFDAWKQDVEQVDDVCIIGVRVNLFSTT